MISLPIFPELTKATRRLIQRRYARSTDADRQALIVHLSAVRWRSRAQTSRIQDRTATVGTAWAGCVGLPLAMEFASGSTIGYDERTRKLLMRGESHIQDVPPADVARC